MPVPSSETHTRLHATLHLPLKPQRPEHIKITSTGWILQPCLSEDVHRVDTVAAIGNPHFVDGVQAPRLSVLLHGAYHNAHYIGTHHNVESVMSRTLPSLPGTAPQFPLFHCLAIRAARHVVSAAAVTAAALSPPLGGTAKQQHQHIQSCALHAADDSVVSVCPPTLSQAGDGRRSWRQGAQLAGAQASVSG